MGRPSYRFRRMLRVALACLVVAGVGAAVMAKPDGPARASISLEAMHQALPAEGLVVPHPDSAHTSLHDPVSTQISLLTND